MSLSFAAALEGHLGGLYLSKRFVASPGFSSLSLSASVAVARLLEVGKLLPSLSVPQVFLLHHQYSWRSCGDSVSHFGPSNQAGQVSALYRAAQKLHGSLGQLVCTDSRSSI